MKSTTFLFAVAFVAIAFPSQAQKSGVKHAATKMAGMPYKVENTNLRFSNSQYSLKVMQAWKAYDDNDIDRVAHLFADDVWGTLADGTVIKGKEAFVDGIKEYRSGFSWAISEVIACTTMKSAEDPGRDATLIWGRETDIRKDGTTQKVGLHEVWFFNKAGKVVEFHQYAAPIKEEMK